MRPFSQPPMFDYDRFHKEFIPTDKMMLDMFPTDPVGRTAYRDALTEHEVVSMFSDWADVAASSEVDDAFHKGLAAELRLDLESTGDEYYRVKQSLTALQIWQETFVDKDGELTFAQSELNRGRNIFRRPEGAQAREKYTLRLEPIPKDDLVSWECCHLDADGGTTRIEEELKSGEEPFEASHFGGLEARPKWGYLQWEYDQSSRLNVENQARTIEWCVTRGFVDIFLSTSRFDTSPEWACESAKVRIQHLVELPRPPKHDLQTWEWFHLDEDGGTAKIIRGLEAGEPPFESVYFGGVEARAKWGYLQWEHDLSCMTGESRSIEMELKNGVDVFAHESWYNCGQSTEWACESAEARYKHLVDMLLRPPKHDLQTWEWFHLDEDGGTTKIRDALNASNPLFETMYFGGVEARAKWGYLKWEHDDSRRSEEPRTIEMELEKGLVVFAADSYISGWRSEEWACESAEARYKHLVDMLSPPPKHDLQTWEWFHLDENGGTTKIRDAMEAGIPLFEAAYVGGTAARKTYGYLASNLMRAGWGEDERHIAEEIEAKMEYEASSGSELLSKGWKA